MALQDWLAFVIAPVVVLVVPGPTILTVNTTSLHDRQPAVIVVSRATNRT